MSAAWKGSGLFFGDAEKEPRPLSYLVTDRGRAVPGARTLADELLGLEAWIDAAIDAGIDAVQIRERDLSARALTDLAIRICRRAEGGSTRVFVNDRADVALAAGAAGVHLRADGPPIARVRGCGPPRWLVGRSTHTLAEIGVAGDADYVIFGPVFPTESKPAGTATTGLAGLRGAVAVSRVPVLAIGGIDDSTTGACLDAGAAGIAGIGLWLPGPDLRARVWAVREKR
jgi:thiamine-phosphate pyrophosphorylase